MAPSVLTLAAQTPAIVTEVQPELSNAEKNPAWPGLYANGCVVAQKDSSMDLVDAEKNPAWPGLYANGCVVA